jgi:hypothetical protein
MKFADHVKPKQKKQLGKIQSPNKKKQHEPKKKREEKIDWHDLMGSNNRGYYRGKGGALKRR